MADRRYETLVLIHPDAGEPGAKEIAERIKKLIEDQGGTVSQVQDWGARELAYLIAKQRRAFYVLFEYRATSKALLEIERNLKLQDTVLRYLSVLVELETDVAKAREEIETRKRRIAEARAAAEARMAAAAAQRAEAAAAAASHAEGAAAVVAEEIPDAPDEMTEPEGGREQD